MKRRNRVLLMWMLTGIWLCVQSPWVHAQRLQAHAQAVEQALAQAAVDPAVDADPCHADEHAAHQPAPAHSNGCCTGDQCDGHCALSWAVVAAPPQLILRGSFPPVPMQVAGVQSTRQPELFRPPI